MKLPQGKATNALAILTALCFVILFLFNRIDDAAASGGFIASRLGGLMPYATDWPLVPAWLTPLSCTLVHASFLHLGFNLLMLMFCGRFVEQVVGPGLMLLLYVIGAYAAALLEYATGPMATDPMVGASGAISALMGTYALLYSQQKVRRIGPFSANTVRIAWLAAAWTVLQLMIGTVGLGSGIGNIAVWAHIGGFLAGLILTRPILHWRFRQRRAAEG